MRRRRSECSLAQRRNAAEALLAALRGFAPYEDARAVVGYFAADNEVPTDALLADAAARGKELYLPRVVERDLLFAAYSVGAALAPGFYGIPEPQGPAVTLGDIVTPALVLIPLLAWDRTGNRLGRGAGYYDRALCQRRDGHCLLGVGYAFQECTRLPHDAWDVPVHFIVTEQERVHCRSGETPPRTLTEDTNAHGIRDDAGGQCRAGRDLHLGTQPPPRPAR